MNVNNNLNQETGVLQQQQLRNDHLRHKKLPYRSNASFSPYNSYTSIYFTWFSAIIFLGELTIDIGVACYYLSQNQIEWGTVTLMIILLPSVLCQIYSVMLMRSDVVQPTKKTSQASAIFWHVVLLGIPFRYYDIFWNVGQTPVNEVRHKIQEVQAIQTLNAFLQYFPQCICQTFLIVYYNFSCVFTGVSAGLSGFSFLWHLFFQCYSLLKRGQEEYRISAGPNFTSNTRINNLENNSSSLATIVTTCDSTTSTLRNEPPDFSAVESNLQKNLKILEKNSLMDNRNLAPKGTAKNVEKTKIFQFNKRRPIYQREEDSIESDGFYNTSANKSTVYYEVDEGDCSKNRSVGEDDCLKPDPNGSGSDAPCFPQLKRKGICSSQEMLHLVDLMNENITADQIDKLAKSLVELNGNEDNLKIVEHRSIHSSSDDLDSTKLFKGFPESVDESTQSSILENIDAAIYENQIIFQERIKKNQLTIQNLKLQDQILSEIIDLNMKQLTEKAKEMLTNENIQSLLINTDEKNDQSESQGTKSQDPHNTSAGFLSTRDYENMCFVNITRNMNKGMKHWRNYIQSINNNQHDNSSVLNSSYFVNTTTTNSGYTTIEDSSSVYSSNQAKSSKLDPLPPKSDDIYVMMQPLNANKNILVETINKINVDSPLKSGQPESSSRSYLSLDIGTGSDEEEDEEEQDVKRESQQSEMDTQIRRPNPRGGQSSGYLYYYMMPACSPLDSILENNSEDII